MCLVHVPGADATRAVAAARTAADGRRGGPCGRPVRAPRPPTGRPQGSPRHHDAPIRSDWLTRATSGKAVGGGRVARTCASGSGLRLLLSVRRPSSFVFIRECQSSTRKMTGDWRRGRESIAVWASRVASQDMRNARRVQISGLPLRKGRAARCRFRSSLHHACGSAGRTAVRRMIRSECHERCEAAISLSALRRRSNTA
jgi:hypothetical protein